MHGLSIVCFAPVLLALITDGMPAQAPTLPPGFTSQARYSDQDLTRIFDTRGFAVDPLTDELYIALGSGIFRVDESGLRILVDDLGPGQDVGLLMRPPGARELFYTSLAGGTVYRRDLQTGTTEVYRGPRFAFDLVLTGAGEILMSANPFFQTDPDGGIWQVDREGAAPREVIELVGPSGPVLMDAGGNLLYATQSSDFPPPPGSTSVLSFSAALLDQALASGAPLTMADAQLALGNLDGAYDMVFDDMQRLLISNTAGYVYRTRPGMMLLDPVPMAELTSSPLQMEFDGRRADANFAPHQPPFGGALHVLDSNFSDLVAVRRLEPLRPTIISSPTAIAGPGAVDFFVQDGLFPGQAWIVASFQPTVPEQPVAFFNGFPLWVALDLTAPTVGFPLSPDLDGTATVRLQHPGGFSATMRFQSVVIGIDASGWVWGSSEPYTLQLQR